MSDIKTVNGLNSPSYNTLIILEVIMKTPIYKILNYK